MVLRETLFDAPFYRLVHAEADGLPGVVADQFGDVLSVQLRNAGVERHRDLILTLGRVSEVGSADAAPTGAVTFVSGASTVALSLAGVIDLTDSSLSGGRAADGK